MTLPGAPQPPRSSLDLGRSPTTDAEVNAMRAAAWHRLGVVVIPVNEITDPWLRQAIINEANCRWGQRNGGQGHGR